MRTHLKTQSGEKLNKCNQCDYASSRADVLRTLLKAHNGEKSNKCNQCDFAPSLRTRLKTHSGGCRRFEEAENRVGHADAFADANQMRINVNRCESSAYCAKIIISFVTKKLPFWLRFSKSLGPEAQLTNALCTYGVSPSQVPRPFCETLMSWGTCLGFSPVCVRR